MDKNHLLVWKRTQRRTRNAPTHQNAHPCQIVFAAETPLPGVDLDHEAIAQCFSADSCRQVSKTDHIAIRSNPNRKHKVLYFSDMSVLWATAQSSMTRVIFVHSEHSGSLQSQRPLQSILRPKQDSKCPRERSETNSRVIELPVPVMIVWFWNMCWHRNHRLCPRYGRNKCPGP